MTALVELLGPSWRPWLGRWSSHRVLVARKSTWRLEVDGHVEGEWPSLAAAAENLWPNRQRVDDQPWAVGYMTYEACADHAGHLPRRNHDSGLPAAMWLIEPENEPMAQVDDGPPQRPEPHHVSASIDDAGFATGVERVRDQIAAGNVYQVNLTRRFTIDDWPGDLSLLAAAATAAGVPPYLSRVEYDDGEILCASMELLLRRRGRALETAPIKGTRPRGGTRLEDQQLKDDLDGDPKERAELAMIVDLERNDLGRVADSGSVAVTDPGRVESFNTVHHRVARVTAEAGHDLPWWRVLEVMAPGGSITGCPKIAAMDLIRRLEPGPRGPYTGALGVVAGNGDLEVALPIRTAWRRGRQLHFAAGCGIVWESEALAEVAESRLKVSRWLELGDGARS